MIVMLGGLDPPSVRRKLHWSSQAGGLLHLESHKKLFLPEKDFPHSPSREVSAESKGPMSIHVVGISDPETPLHLAFSVSLTRMKCDCLSIKYCSTHACAYLYMSLCVCVYVCPCTWIHYVLVCLCMCIRTFVYVHLCVYMHLCVYTCMPVCMCLYVCVYVLACVHACIFMCVMCVCVFMDVCIMSLCVGMCSCVHVCVCVLTCVCVHVCVGGRVLRFKVGEGSQHK